jgi:nitrous oxide reductase accessory protein NosL
MKRTVPAILAVTLLAAACTDDAAAPAEGGGEAAGQVLGGEISDAMIPLEQIESQAPLAPRQAPSATDVDSEQPEVAGEAAPQSETSETAPAAPQPAPAE